MIFVLLLVGMSFGSELKAQDAMLGEVRIFAGNFAPRGWAFCDGQALSIAQNTALFSLLGTTYGGDGRTTFKLPKLTWPAPPPPVAKEGKTLPRREKRPKPRASGAPSDVQNDGSKVKYIICMQGIYPSRS